MRKAGPSVPQRQFVAVRLGSGEFALDVFAVYEVLRLHAVAPVPRAPDFVEGVVDVRGTLIPVVDMRKRFDVADPQDDDDARLVVARVGEDRIGLVVDRVTEVLRVPETALAPPPPYLQSRAADSLTAILRLPERLLLVLDLERLLSSDERIRLRELESAIEELRTELRDAEAAASGGGDADPAGDAG